MIPEQFLRGPVSKGVVLLSLVPRPFGEEKGPGTHSLGMHQKLISVKFESVKHSVNLFNNWTQ